MFPPMTDKVFLDYTQEELDRAYDQRVWAPEAEAIMARYDRDSEAARAQMPPLTLPYGPTPAEQLDIFAPKGAKNLPVMVFIHGGAWRERPKEQYSAAAPMFVGAGAIYIALGFACIPTVRLPVMAEQCRRALLWVRRNIAAHGGDPERIFISGHSSGGHLGGVMVTTDWTALGAPSDFIRGATLLSGMYDLHPVMLSARSSYVQIDEREQAALSAMRHLDRLACPVVVGWGERESPDFRRQSFMFAEALAGMGRLSQRVQMPAANHFETWEQLYDPATPTSRATLRMMGLA
jgi:arylformamidase